jgi:prophage regulatory protein
LLPLGNPQSLNRHYGLDQTSTFPVRDRILRLAEVEAKIGFRKTKIWEMVNENAFPAPIAIGPKAIGWRETEIDSWIAALPRAPRQNPGLQKARAARHSHQSEAVQAAA